MLTVDDAGTAGRYVADNKLMLNGVVPIPSSKYEQLRVPGTPTLILVDRAGVIQQMWLGKLDASREAQVISALTEHS
jgi:hypothetical protein